MMRDRQIAARRSLTAALRPALPLCAAAGGLSVIGNLLMLTGPLYMIQVYDRAVPAGSVETLVALSLIMGFCYATITVTDIARQQILARAGARVEAALGDAVFGAGLAQARQGRPRAAGSGVQDLDAVAAVFAAPVATVAFDLPFTAVFLALLWMLHPALCLAGIVSGAVLMALPWLRRILVREAETDSEAARLRAAALLDALACDADATVGAGLAAGGRARWQAIRRTQRNARIVAEDRGAFFTAMAKSVRLFVQSAALGLGAWLAITGAMSLGVVFAVSVMLARSLAPLEALMQGWPMLARAHRGWRSLQMRLADVSATPAPAPRALRPPLEMTGLWLRPPGAETDVLRDITLSVAAGEVLGVVGSSGSGKSTLLRAACGIHPPARGQTRLGGLACARLTEADRAAIGFLPQTVLAQEVSIAAYIARLAPDPDRDAVEEAARTANIHAEILALPGGYDSALGPGGQPFSVGQLRRLGLARALHGQPALLCLDEPEAHADGAALDSICAAIATAKWWGGAVLVAAHRPDVLMACDRLAWLDRGRLRALGPRDEILAALRPGSQAA